MSIIINRAAILHVDVLVDGVVRAAGVWVLNVAGNQILGFGGLKGT